MKPTLWHRISDVLDDVLDLPADERAAAVRSRCAGDDALLSAVLDHLEADQSDGLLDQAFDASSMLEEAASRDESALGPGDTIGRYRVRDRIGSGGMGTVYRAEDPNLGRDVAIKLLDRRATDSAEARFSREARSLAAINHPNISTIYELSSDDGRPFIAMELVPGRTLADLPADMPSADQSVAIARQIASALEAAHSRDVIHRDLKPRNVIVTPEGTAKVLDFGLAKRLADRELGGEPARVAAPDLTGAGGVLGSPGYMSPEQIRGDDLDERTDLFSFGCVLFELLTGRAAFPGDTEARLSGALTGEVDFGDVSAVPSPLRRLLRSCLSVTARERPTATEARQVLDGLVEEARLRGSRGKGRRAADHPFRGGASRVPRLVRRARPGALLAFGRAGESCVGDGDRGGGWWQDTTVAGVRP